MNVRRDAPRLPSPGPLSRSSRENGCPMAHRVAAITPDVGRYPVHVALCQVDSVGGCGLIRSGRLH